MTTTVDHQTSQALEDDTASFLQELSDLQAELLKILGVKRQQMIANDLEAMENSRASEEALLQRLQQLHESRQHLLSDARKQGLPSDSVRSLAKAIDSNDSTLSNQADGAQREMRHVQNETLTNFVLAQQTVLHLSQLLQIIATGGKIKPTYEAENASNQGGTLVDQDA